MSASSQEGAGLDTYQAVVLAFRDFLTVAIHTILYERDVYPRASFLKARKYNYPVRQSRHPKVCRWIQDAVAAVEVEMLKCTIHSTSLVLSSPPPTCTPLERYTFSTASFPQIPPSEHLTPFSPPPTSLPGTGATPASLLPQKQQEQQQQQQQQEPPLPQNLLSQFRATIARFTTILPTLAPLPADCTFTLAIELRDAADAPIGVSVGNVQPWIVAQPGMQHEQRDQKDRRDRTDRRDQKNQSEQSASENHSVSTSSPPPAARDTGLRSVRTTPIRSLETGAFVMEVWVEEGRGKIELEGGSGGGGSGI